MKRSRPAMPKWTGLLGIAAVLGVIIGSQTLPAQPVTASPSAQQNPGTITVRKQVVDASGNIVANAPLANNVFTLATNGAAETQRTGITGAVSFQNVPPGNYTLTETPAEGFTFLEFVLNGQSAPNGSTLTLNPGGQLEITARNRSEAVGAAAMGTVNITKRIVDANGNVVAGADRSGFVFGFGLVTGPTVRSPDFLPVTTATGTSSTTLAPGTWRLFEQVRGTCTARDARVGSVLFSGSTFQLTGVMSNVEFTVSAGQTIAIEVNNTCPGAGMGMAMMPSGPTRSDRLVAGCNNLALTFPVGTPLATVAQGVSASAQLVSIFRLNAATGRFFGFSPGVPEFANDYTMVGVRLEAVFICVRAAGTLTQPEV